jgi:hypothetical protein
MSLMLNSGTWDDPRGPCEKTGVCQLARAQVTLNQAQNLIRRAEEMRGRSLDGKVIMSQALWCDAGEHAFTSRDPKREHWQRTLRDENGEEIEIPWDVCGPCATGGGTPGFNMAERHAIMTGQPPGTADPSR